MRPAGELAEHAPRVVAVGRLAVDAAVEDDGGVDAEGDEAVRVDRARLALGVPAHELDRIGVGRVVLDVRWARPTSNGIRSCSRIARRCGEVDASVSRSCAPPQISSTGHLLAHSAVT